MGHPIYIEYYSHEGADCYKIDLPWDKFLKSTMVLCKVTDGYEQARLLAIGVISKHITEITLTPPKEEKKAEVAKATCSKQKPLFSPSTQDKYDIKSTL